ncbi:Universal stress protein [Halomicronema hongdechloris C2206]|uniref:Universal stress protein n=1 Tax=Halomicronema hongdechloris C2206 TaxID=1641165 RepID=A0A1Z3HPY1_9CYAN|nr:universal stress protein [Halomicronema hongdechloris]ASC72227.1 Universal stress protein [Halomicronema hongdechloris C2206]
MKHILLCTDGSRFAQSSYRYAGWLASRLEAEVDVLFVSDIRSQKVASTGNYSGAIGLGASRELLDKLVELEHEKARINHEKAQLVLQDAEAQLRAAGVTAIDLIHETGFLVDIFHRFEATADLIILGKRGEAAEFASDHLGANMERIARASHKPCLITCRHYKPIERLLLAYDGGKSCQKMLHFLVASPAFQGLDLHIVTAGKKADDETAKAHLKVAAMEAESAGFRPTCQMIPGAAEKVITQYIQAHDISLLLMGAYGHSRIRHLVLGSTTIQLLRSSPVPVLLFR